MLRLRDAAKVHRHHQGNGKILHAERTFEASDDDGADDDAAADDDDDDAVRCIHVSLSLIFFVEIRCVLALEPVNKFPRRSTWLVDGGQWR